MLRKVVILAAGLGSRMQRAVPGIALAHEQTLAADKGLKALIPIDRPFLDYLLSNVAAAGYRHVCLVIGPQHGQVRSYYQSLHYQQITVEFAIQQEPLGTAHALLAAEPFADDDPVLVLNGDNLYPTEVLRQLRKVNGSALAGFDRTNLIKHSNIGPERIAAYALLRTDPNGFLREIVEKPNPEMLRNLPDPILVSMNCWRLPPDIFPACRLISRSPRDEFELPDAVMTLMQNQGARFQVVRSQAGVLDLSSREDIESVTKRLRGVEVHL